MVVGGKREPASDSQLADVGPCSSVLGSELGPFLGGLGVWGDDGCGVRLQRWCGVAVQLGRVVLQSFPAVEDTVDDRIQREGNVVVNCLKPGVEARGCRVSRPKIAN